MAFARLGIPSALAALGLLLQSCESGEAGPVAPTPIACEDPSILKLAPRPLSRHNKPVRLPNAPSDLEKTKWAAPEAVKAFFGGKDVKVVFTLDKKMYLAEYKGGKSAVSLISHDDEGLSGEPGSGSINSPLFSPDGSKIVFAGTTRGKPAFVQDAVGAEAEALRVPLDPKARVTADPHWHVEAGRTWIYFSTLPGLVNYVDHCGQVAGATYRLEVKDDTTMGPMEVTGIPGAYRGGLSKDGLWAGTSYASSTLYDKSRDTTLLLEDGDQQCNPSMNPFPSGSRRSDYMMILAFGGKEYSSITGKPLMEGLHENLWIYNRDDRIVWQAKRPDSTVYRRWDKPEWSTHPEYATAVAIRHDDDGDLVAVRIGNLAEAEEDTLHQASGYFKIAEGGFTSDSYSHLWVAP